MELYASTTKFADVSDEDEDFQGFHNSLGTNLMDGDDYSRVCRILRLKLYILRFLYI
jgi:hypothetical protein